MEFVHECKWCSVLAENLGWGGCRITKMEIWWWAKRTSVSNRGRFQIELIPSCMPVACENEKSIGKIVYHRWNDVCRCVRVFSVRLGRSWINVWDLNSFGNVYHKILWLNIKLNCECARYFVISRRVRAFVVVAFFCSLGLILICCVRFSIVSLQVKQLGNKSVSWVRVRDDHILSVDR